MMWWWYLIVVWVYMFLNMTNFSWVYCPSVYHFWRNVFWGGVLGLRFHWVIILLPGWIKVYLSSKMAGDDILFVPDPYQLYMVCTFFSFNRLFSHFLNKVLWCTKCSPMYLFLVSLLVLCVSYLRIYCQVQGHKDDFFGIGNWIIIYCLFA